MPKMTGQSESKRTFLFPCLLVLALCPLVVDAFSNPSFSVGSFRPAGRATSLTPNMGNLCLSNKMSRNSSWHGALKDTGSSDFISKGAQENHVRHDHSIPASLMSWLDDNKSSILTSAAVMTTAAFVLPSASLAVPALGELTAAGSTGSLSASTSAFAEWASGTGFYQAFSLVFLSEIGDKTFFIAGLLSMKTSRFVSFVGSISALAVMTVISCVIGQIFHAVPSGLAQGLPLDDIAAVLAFTFFGLKTLKEAIDLDPSEGNAGMDEEFADAEEAVETSAAIKQATAWAQIISTFGLVFAAEFGDRSFLATIALSAAQNPFSVAGGAIAAHAVATGIAVIGGGVIAKYVSEKVIGYIGGSLFLVFAVTTALGVF